MGRDIYKMRVFTSLVELKYFVPESTEDHMVQYKYPLKSTQIYCWNDGWIRKIYWTPEEAAAFIGESQEDVRALVRRKYSSMRRRYQNSSHIKLTYQMLAPIKQMIEQTKSI